MKLKALVLALFVAGLCASFALADDGVPGAGSTTAGTTTSGEQHRDKHGNDGACRPGVSVLLKGSLVSTAAGSFVMDVKRASHHGRTLAGKQQTIAVDERTQFKRRGRATLADLKPGDRLTVKARACKRAKDGSAAALQLVAHKVGAHAANSDRKDEGAGDDRHATTTAASSSSHRDGEKGDKDRKDERKGGDGRHGGAPSTGSTTGTTTGTTTR